MAHRFSLISGVQDFRESPGKLSAPVKALGEFCQLLQRDQELNQHGPMAPRAR
jgi:hypothetical protein